MGPYKGDSNHHRINSLIICALTTMSLFSHCGGQVYEDISKLFDDKFGPDSGYKTTIHPKRNHSHATQVNVTFDIIAISQVEATTQKFAVNGFMGLYWIDELLAWDPAKYNVYYIHPEPKQIWRPRMILVNTIDKRDLFQDDYSPLTAVFNGFTYWFPGSIFSTSCKLDLYKYPFDEQECKIEMIAMSMGSRELIFHANVGEVSTVFFVESGEWSIKSTQLLAGGNADMSYVTIIFNLKRLPGFFIVNIVTPIVLMSFLNILVFLIPVESGEKIGYGITVLLALTVFMSIVGEQLPRSSDTLPIVTVYLLVLTIISVCTVMMSIVIVYLHHRDEKEVKHKKVAAEYKSALHKFSIMNRAAKNFSKVKHVAPVSQDTRFSNSSTKNADDRNSSETLKNGSETIFNVMDEMKDGQDDKNFETSHSVNRWRQIGKHIDSISFVVFTGIWMSVTIGFLVEMAR